MEKRLPVHRTRNIIVIAIVGSAAQLLASGAVRAQVFDDPPGVEFYGPLSSLRLQVQPSQTEVFVDGYYAGAAREFDGLFERLRIDSGEHDIELYLQGYKSVHQKVYLQPDETFRVRHTMQALASGEAQEARPIAPPPPPGGDPGVGGGRRPAAPPMPMTGQRPPAGSARGGGESDFGAIAIRVQPADAELLVDGELWDASGTGNRLTIQLPEGSHRVEIRKPGFQAFTTVIQIRRGETATLNVSLTQE
jgi:hypothetical protein